MKHNLDYVNLKISTSFPGDSLNEEYDIKIYYDEEYIGDISLIKINPYKRTLVDSFDETRSLFRIYEALREGNIITESNNLNIDDSFIEKITVIDRIQLNNKYKGFGLGKKAINLLFEYFGSYQDNLFCLKSFPLQHEVDNTLDDNFNLDDKQLKLDLYKLNLYYISLDFIELKVENDFFYYKIV